MQKTVLVIRGCSGSGKSTFAKLLTSLIPNSAYVEADSFFEDDKGNTIKVKRKQVKESDKEDDED